MKHPQNVDLLAIHSVWNEERVGLQHKLSCSWYAARTTHSGLSYQQIDQAIHLEHKLLGNPRVLFRQVIMGILQIQCSLAQPFNLH